MNNNIKLKINPILPDMNKQKMKNAYRTLIESTSYNAITISMSL